MFINKKLNKSIVAICGVFVFAFIAVFGMSVFTLNSKDSNIKQSKASAQEPADINSDESIDIFDLSTLLSSWNHNGVSLSDINGDLVVNIFDLSTLISKWGSVAVQPLPKQGVSTGYKIVTRTAAERKIELDAIQKAFNGKPGFVRLDANPGNAAQLDPVVNDVVSRGMTPLLILYGTTNPIPADTYGHDQAVKWLGKVKYFEIANEPDNNGWTPDTYADFVKNTSISVKSGNPHAVVIAGALWKGAGGYTTQNYASSLATRAKGYFDILSLHLYDDPKARGSWNIWDMTFPTILGVNTYYKGNTVREILDSNGLAAMPIISTESGGPVDKYAESGQNTIVNNGFDIVQSGQLSSLLVYSMKNDDVVGFGLLRDDNSERPAFTTFMNRSQ